MVLDVHRTPFDQDSDVVCTELMAPPISSVLFPQDVSARTPQLRQQIDAHGYLAVDVTPDAPDRRVPRARRRHRPRQRHRHRRHLDGRPPATPRATSS